MAVNSARSTVLVAEPEGTIWQRPNTPEESLETIARLVIRPGRTSYNLSNGVGSVCYLLDQDSLVGLPWLGATLGEEGSTPGSYTKSGSLLDARENTAQPIAQFSGAWTPSKQGLQYF